MKLNSKEEAKAHLLGRIAGLNDVRLSVWGIGYDKNETAQRIRKYTCDEISRIKEILVIDTIGDDMFSDANQILQDELNKGAQK